jgi:hypothetical protein
MGYLVEPEPEMIEYATPYRERVAFFEEYGPDQYIKLVISGPITGDTLETLIIFLDRQKRRIEDALKMAKKRQTKADILKEHRHWLRYYLNQARLEVKSRCWIRASEAYRSAAFHRRLLDLTTAPRR